VRGEGDNKMYEHKKEGIKYVVAKKNGKTGREDYNILSDFFIQGTLISRNLLLRHFFRFFNFYLVG